MDYGRKKKKKMGEHVYLPLESDWMRNEFWVDEIGKRDKIVGVIIYGEYLH